MHTNDDTRAGAVTGLAYQGGSQGATRLRLLYDQEDSEEVQRRIIHGLGHLATQLTCRVNVDGQAASGLRFHALGPRHQHRRPYLLVRPEPTCLAKL